MRDIAKSTLSAGLAMSLFGMQQMLSAFRRPRQGEPHPASEAMDSVTHAMVDSFDEALRSTFQASDRVQRETVELMFRFFNLQPLRTAGGSSMVFDAARQTTDRFRRWLGDIGAGACRSCGGEDIGATTSAAGNPRPKDSRPWSRQSQDPSYGNAGERAQPGEGWGPIPPEL